MKVLTLVTPATLPQARVLAASLARHQPDWPHELLLIGREEGANVAGSGPAPRSIAEELDVELEHAIARHDAASLQRLLLPRVLKAQAERGEGPVLHLPPSAWLLADLGPFVTALERHDVALVPRMSGDVPADGLQPTREQMELAGRISDTIVAVGDSPAALGFLVWWFGYVEQMLGSLDGERRGARPEDLPWLARMLELAPARFTTAVIDDPGVNLSLWNLHERTLETSGDGDGDGVVVDGRAPLRLLDLPGFEPGKPYRLSPSASRARVSRSPALGRLTARYAAELDAAGWAALDRSADIGRRLGAGLVYDDVLAALHGLAESLGERFGDLFAPGGEEPFLRWLKAPAPVGGGHGINRYVFYRVARERPDVLRAYPDLAGPDGREYVAWCWAFGKDEMTIPEQFMPPRPGEAQDAPAAEPPAGAGEPAPDEPGPDEPGEPGPDEPALGEPAPGERQRLGERPAAGEPGPSVRVSGYLGHALGLGAAARGYAQALAAANVPVSTASVPLHHLELPTELASGYGLHSFEDVAHAAGRHDVEIVAVNADELPGFVDRLGPGYFTGPRIGIWGWETNSIPARWQRAFELVEEIWVYSRFMAENIGAVAPVPVLALPPPVQAPAEPATPLRLGLPGEDFLFLFVFDYLSTIQRKNPVGLIEAFKRAFAPGEGPRLLLKTINAPLRPLAEEEVLWAAERRPDIHVIDRSLSAAERDGLMAGCDCYVSLHRSEGFGLTMAEAMAIGKPVIATGYSGNLDFMDATNSLLVDYEPTLVGPECEIYPADGEWAQPSVEHAAELMRRVVADPVAAAELGANAREHVARALSPRATGEAMRRRLLELTAARAATASSA
ncbi:MAG TPA: glycosyltransferase family 4 protein [Solirubrobacteraceae bacterium]|nr:glycosyltransferase family 4 protein [Solirubrobacteraceae bacterium]